MEQSPLAMELLTPDGKIARVNSSWRLLWDVDEDGGADVLAKYNMLDDDQARDLGVAGLIKKGFAGENVVLPPIEYSGQQTAEEFNIEGVKAKTVWIQCHLNPIRNEKQEIEYIVNTYVDITALKRSEDEAHRQREVLARMSRVTRMEQLTGSIAHEINQPLTGILSNAQAGEMMVQAEKYDPGEMAEIMAEIAADARRASEVIQSLRGLYRKQKVGFDPVDINAIVEETEHLLHSEFILQQVEITTECAPSSPMVAGNMVQLQQVLVNLIVNAAEAMKSTTKDTRRIHVATAHDANEVRAWVEDCGPGIDPDRIDAIFEPLATWKPGGTGMGLAISNSIIEAHRGKMWAENRPEGGARVGFILPAMKEGQKA
jgi:signal transduction histidine kinase